MPNRSIRFAARSWRLAALVAALSAASAVPVFAAGMRVLSSDDRSITLRVELPAHALRPGSTPGRQRIGVAELEVWDEPGRPLLPYATVLLAVPPGSRAVATLLPVEDEAVTEGVRLEVAKRPDFRVDEADGTAVPVREPVAAIADGRWPSTPVAVSEPFPWRGHRLVRVVAHPFTTDEASARLWTRRRFDVRIEFVEGRSVAPSPLRSATDGFGRPDVAARAILERAVVNPAQAERWREAPRPARRVSGLDARSLIRPPAAGAAAATAFDEDFAEVRVRVDTTGVWAMDFASLAANGYPAGVPIDRVSVHRHEFAEGVTPPYVTIELPIDVDDRNGNLVFDAPDRVIAYVETWARRSGATLPQRAWGDAEFVFVTRTSAPALRMSTRSSWRGAVGLTPLASYPWTQRYERTFGFFLVPDDTTSDRFNWIEEVLYYSRPDSILFETNHLDPSRNATIAINYIGRTPTSHVAWVEVRNSPTGPFTSLVDSTNGTWAGKTSFTPTAVVPGSVLGEGNVNRMRTWGRIQGFPDPVNNGRLRGSLNWFDVTYWRQYRTLNASGPIPRSSFLACNSGDAAGEYQIRATGLTGGASRDVKLYDVTDPLNPIRLTLADTLLQIQSAGAGEFRVDFQDSAVTGQRRQYAVFSTPKFLPAARYSPVVRRTLTNRTGADYVVIVPEAFLPAAQQLVTHREAQGMQVLLAPAEAVFDEFNGGRKSAHAIKRFLRYAYENWGTMFALLIGDASQDPRGQLSTSSRDWLPTLEISGPVGISLGLEIIPADPWYGCIENNCNLNDAIADVPDIAVGRIPSQTLAQAQDAVAKIIAYEQFAPDQSWRNKLLLVADDAYSGESFFGGGGGGSQYCYKSDELVFEEISDTIAATVRGPSGLALTQIDRFDLSDYLTGEPEDASRCRPDLNATRDRTHAAVTPLLLSRLNAGVMWFNFQGHANEFVLGHENLYLNTSGIDDKDNLTNDGMPFLFSAFSCHANAFARPGDNQNGPSPCLGEEMVLLPLRGAIASWASSGYEILPDQGGQHVNTSLARRMFVNPPHSRFLGSTGSRVLLGESIMLALLDYVSPFRFFERGVGLTYHLFGDPLQQLSIGPVQALVKANEIPVSSGVAIRLGTPGDTLRLDADLVSNVQIASLQLEHHAGTTVDTIPAADYTVTPAFPDTGLTGSGGRRFRLVHRSTLVPNSFRYVIRTTDRYGVPSSFDAVFDFFAQLRVSGTPIANGDAVAPEADLTMLVLSPKPIDPLADLTLTINGAPQAFTAAPANGDANGREWILSWAHATYPIDDYNVRLVAQGGAARDLLFRVTVGGGDLRLVNVVNFPNPFEERLGTFFSFSVQSGSPADVLIRVYTPGGRLVYQRHERGLLPGYHQLPWDGRDTEGSHLANGVYLGRLVATNGSSTAESTMRIVKLRRPRGADDGAATP